MVLGLSLMSVIVAIVFGAVFGAICLAAKIEPVVWIRATCGVWLLAEVLLVGSFLWAGCEWDH